MTTMLTALRKANLMSVDPGDKWVGVSLWQEVGHHEPIEIFRDRIERDEFVGMLVDMLAAELFFQDLRRVVIEGYRLNKSRNRGGSTLLTSRTIGAVELFAAVLGAEVTMQNPEAYIMAAKFTMTSWPGQHCPDDVSAFLHAVYFYEAHGVELRNYKGVV